MRPVAGRGSRSLLAALAGVVLTGAPAWAAWALASSAASSTVQADALPTGTAPTSLTRLGRDVDVTWPQVSFRSQLLGTLTGAGYVLQRDGSPAGGACAGTLAPAAAATSTCRETGLAPGTYAYTVTPLLSGWTGPSSATTSITVPSPSLVFSPASWSAPGTALQGTVDAFLDGAGLTYRLDDATTGAVLAGTLATFPTAPAAPPTTSVPVGCGASAGTGHTVYAVSSGGEQAAGAFTADFGAVLCPASVSSTAGSSAGTVQAGDTLSITFSRPVDGSTVCDGLGAGVTTAASLLVTVQDGGAGNDTLSVTAPAATSLANQACGSTAICIIVCLPGLPGTVALGSVDLGSTSYATGGDVRFASSRLALDAGRTVLTISLLGTPSGGTAGAATAGVIGRYAPTSAVKSLTGSLSAQGFQTSGTRLF